MRQRDLPAHVVVYYVIALALYMQSSYREVLRCLLEGLQWLLDPSAAVKVAGKSGISQARTRLGWEPLKQLHDAVVSRSRRGATKGAWYRQWRLVSLDGSTLDVADKQENEKAFGRPGASRGTSAFRRSALYRWWRTAPMCCWQPDERICDRRDHVGQTSCSRFAKECCAWRTGSSSASNSGARPDTGAALLWRIKKNMRLACEKRLPDGSYLSRIYPSELDRRHQTNGIVVRVIDYRLEGVADAEPIYRLVTTILDHKQLPPRNWRHSITSAGRSKPPWTN